MLGLVYPSLDTYGFEPVNSISISGMPTPNHLLGQDGRPYGGKFCVSVSVLFAVFYGSSIILSFTLVRLLKQSQPWKKCSDEILLDQFYINDHLKVFITAVCPKKGAKLSKGGELTVKSGIAFSNFLK